jgi:hypothetical protein
MRPSDKMIGGHFLSFFLFIKYLGFCSIAAAGLSNGRVFLDLSISRRKPTEPGSALLALRDRH